MTVTDVIAPVATRAWQTKIPMEGKRSMYPTNLAEARSDELFQAARKHELVRRISAANRWSRIAAWADSRARRAAEELSR